MRKLWIAFIILCLIMSAFSVFYVAVGASVQPYEEVDYTTLDKLSADREDTEEAFRYIIEMSEKQPKVYSMNGSPVTIEVYANEYIENGIFPMEYTVKRAYLSKEIPEGIYREDLRSEQLFTEDTLIEGYTFLCIDVIIENKDTKKEMYLMNSVSVDGCDHGLLGFAGQRFKNSASLHAELEAGVPFETTLLFAVSEDRISNLQMCINNFGSSYDGSCAFIDLEIEK